MVGSFGVYEALKKLFVTDKDGHITVDANAKANVAAPTWTEGAQVPLSVDLTGALRVATAAAATHNLLSATHLDTVAAAAARGDLIIGNSTPAWTKLALGAAGKVPRSDGTDLLYSTFTIPDTFAVGNMLYCSATNVLSALGIGSTGQVIMVVAGVPAWATPSGGVDKSCYAYSSAEQSITTNTHTAINFEKELFDTDTIHDLVTNNSRLTCKTAGKYVITTNTGWNPAAGGRRLWELYKDGTAGTLLAYAELGTIPDASSWPMMSLATIADLAVNDYVEIYVYQSSGGAVTSRVPGTGIPNLAMMKILG